MPGTHRPARGAVLHFARCRWAANSSERAGRAAPRRSSRASSMVGLCLRRCQLRAPVRRVRPHRARCRPTAQCCLPWAILYQHTGREVLHRRARPTTSLLPAPLSGMIFRREIHIRLYRKVIAPPLIRASLCTTPRRVPGPPPASPRRVLGPPLPHQPMRHGLGRFEISKGPSNRGGVWTLDFSFCVRRLLKPYSTS